MSAAAARPEPASTPVAAPAAAPERSISLSPKAVDMVAAQLDKRGTKDASLRLGVRGGGCSGFSYVIAFHDGAPQARDVVFDFTGSAGRKVRVLVDKKSLVYLDGMTLEWQDTLMKRGFSFVNPNEKASCGCGTSFTV